MKKKLKLIILMFFVLFCLIPLSAISNAATGPDYITNDLLQSNLEKLKLEMISKEQLKEAVERQENNLTKEELTQVLIATQKSRIAILEGNISTLLSLLAVIVAVLTLFGGIYVWASRKAFSSKVEEVEKRLNEMKQLKDEAIAKIETVRELSSNLNVAIREAQDLQINLNKSESVFSEGTERINQLRKYLQFLELKVLRSDNIITFENDVKHSLLLISELDQWLKGKLPSYEIALMKVTEVLGANVIRSDPDETIQEKLSYYKDSLIENETYIRKQIAIPLKWLDYEDKDKDDFIDPLIESIRDWEHSYNRIQQVHGIISAQIAMNPDRFIPKTN